jgi:hypothetical protein
VPCSEASQVIGYSARGLPLTVNTCAPIAHLRAMPRILILAGQHGDESEAREAAAEFLERFRPSPPAPVEIAVLADANPDGAATGTRRNGDDHDLNRDHLLLGTPEIAAVHSFVFRWKPHLIIDVHTYRPARAEVVEHGLVFVQDVMVDIPTNPAVFQTGVAAEIQNELMEFVKDRVAKSGLRCDRYTLVRTSGMVRHSNFDIVDARNSLALRHGIPVLLLEGRRPAQGDPPVFTPSRVALVRSMEAAIEWAGNNAHRITRKPAAILSLTPVPVRCRYAAQNGAGHRRMEALSTKHEGIETAIVPGEYLPLVETTWTVALPRAYAVPADSPVVDVLRRHHFECVPAHRFAGATVEVHRLSSSLPKAHEEEPLPLPDFQIERADFHDGGFKVFPTSQPGGHGLAVLLDAESQFSVHRVAELRIDWRPGTLYPIARIL